MNNLYSILKNDTLIRYKKYDKIELSNNDFKNGTYTIDKPGIYILSENISFKPNEDKDFNPENPALNCVADPFTLGFFAAIRICCEDVVLDLNGYKIEQSIEHALQQRFFAVIELADRPFQSSTGPANFGYKLNPAKNTTIINGIIGRSSHHSIHGNLCSNILVENVTFVDFEISACAINTFDGFVIKNCMINKNRDTVPILAAYSASRFIRTFMKEAILSITDEAIKAEGQQILDNLNNKMSKVFTDIIENGKTDDELFSNNSMLPDGNVYGLMFHGKFNIVDFQDNKEIEFNNLVIEDVTIKNINAKINEVIALANTDGKVFTDPAGSVIQIETITNSDETYKSNELIDCQMFIAEHGNDLALCRSNIHQAKGLIKWKNTPGSFLSDILSEYDYKYVCNGDSMHHLNKGTFGIKMDGGNNIRINNVIVKNINNESNLGSNICGPYETSHKAQSNSTYGFTGCNTRGISASACTNLHINSTFIDNIQSYNCYSVGIDIFNSTTNCILDYVHISNIKAGHKNTQGKWVGINHDGEEIPYTTDLPNKIPENFGVKVDHSSCNIQLKKIKVDGSNLGPTIFTPVSVGNNVQELIKTFV